METSLKVTSATNLFSQFVLALDQGTSSARAILFDRCGSIHGIAQQEITQHYPQPGWVEHDASEIWQAQLAVARGALLGMTRGTTRAHCARAALEAIAFQRADVPVVRPQITETTALGAACLASLAVGFWQDEAELGTLWRTGRRFEPTISTDCRAVERSRHWAQAE